MSERTPEEIQAMSREEKRQTNADDEKPKPAADINRMINEALSGEKTAPIRDGSKPIEDGEIRSVPKIERLAIMEKDRDATAAARQELAKTVVPPAETASAATRPAATPEQKGAVRKFIDKLLGNKAA